ncbi:MAG: AsmA family protein, partial [Planctomycetota bacterium]
TKDGASGLAVTLDGRDLLGLEAEGRWDAARHEVQLDAHWDGATSDGEVHRGVLSLGGALPAAGQVRLDGSIEGVVSLSGGTLELAADLEATGPSWLELDGSVETHDARWIDSTGELDLSGLLARLDRRDRHVRVTELRLHRAASVDVLAKLDLEQLVGTVRFDAEEWTLPRWTGTPVDVSLDATVHGDVIDVHRLEVHHGGQSIVASGRYLPDAERPLSSTVELRVGELDPATAETLDQPGVLTTLEISGRLSPLELGFEGPVSVRRLPLASGAVEAIETVCRGEIRGDRATARSDEFDLLGGRCALDGTYLFDEQRLRISLESEQTQLEELLPTLGAELVYRGRIDTSLEIDWPLPDVSGLAIDGSWRSGEFVAFVVSGDRSEGLVSWSGNQLRLEELEFHDGQSRLTGWLHYDVDGRRIRFDAVGERWPISTIDLGPFDLLADGRYAAEFDLDGTMTDTVIDATGHVMLDTDQVGRLEVRATGADNTYEVEQLSGTFLDGTVGGHAILPVENWIATRGSVTWSSLDFSRLQHWPALEGLEGLVSGSVEVGASRDQRFLDRVEILARIEAESGAYRGMTWTGGDAVAYLAPHRVAVPRARLSVADGLLEASGWRDASGEQPFGKLFVTASNLSISEVRKALAADPAEGRVHARCSITGSLTDLDVHGQGTLRMTEADFGRTPVVATIYSALRTKAAASEPVGIGDMTLTLEGGTLVSNDIHYENR